MQGVQAASIFLLALKGFANGSEGSSLSSALGVAREASRAAAVTWCLQLTAIVSSYTAPASPYCQQVVACAALLI